MISLTSRCSPRDGHEVRGCGDDRAEEQHEERRRQQAARAPRPELREAHGSGGRQLAHQMARDQEARDHEEDVDADIATGDPPRPEVVQHDQQHSDRTQALHVRDEARGFRVLGRRTSRLASAQARGLVQVLRCPGGF